MLLLIVLIPFFARVTNSKQRIYTFFAESENCETISCFAGVIPGETRAGTASQLLAQSSFVDTIETEQIDFLTREIRLTWNGKQPDFLRDEASITLFSAEIEAIEIPTRLTLGDIVSTMGEADTVMLSASSLFLAYSDAGFFVETSLNCDAVWYSSVRISYRWDRFQLSGDDTLNETINQYCIQ